MQRNAAEAKSTAVAPIDHLILETKLETDPMSTPPTQDAVYSKNCWQCWEYNMRRGVWYKVKIPRELAAGDKFVVKDEANQFQIVCKVPLKEILREPLLFTNCERGGGVDEIILHWAMEEIDYTTHEKTPEKFVQGTRLRKESLCNMLKYILPNPLLCCAYLMYYNGLIGGACEEMQDMEWCTRIDDNAIGSMHVVKAEKWLRELFIPAGGEFSDEFGRINERSGARTSDRPGPPGGKCDGANGSK